MRWIVLLALAAGCATAHDVRSHFPAPPDAPTGTLVLQMSEPADHVTVAVNGVLVVDDVRTQHVVVEGIPMGTQQVVMAANGVDKQFTVWIDGDHATTVPLGVPEEGTTFLKTLAGSLLTIVVYSLLHH